MWDRSYRWQRTVRGWAGGLSLVIVAGFCARGGQSESAQRVGVAVQGMLAGRPHDEPVRFQVQVPSLIGIRPGHLVHLQRDDGLPQVIGQVTRVVATSEEESAVEFTIAVAAAPGLRQGAILSAAPPTTGLEQALRLIISPEKPRDEALRAQEALWPTLESAVVPGLTENLVREVRELVINLDVGDRALLLQAVEDLRAELAPLEEDLIRRLSERAWQAVGIRGVAGGVWRLALTGVGNTSKSIRDWIREKFGYDALKDQSEIEFLEEETRRALRAALESELREFWEEHQHDILARVEKVLGDHKAEFGSVVRERWGPALFERAVVPAWLAGEARVIGAIEEYARDFAHRRLVSSAGGPRLVFAHALRGVLEISDAPLLVLSPRESGAAGEVVYRPFIP